MAVTYTVQQAIQLIQERESMDPIRALQLLNEAHLYITTQLKLIPDTSSLITTIAAQQEYALADNVAVVWDAAYWTGGFVQGGSNHFPLKATNTDTLFEDRGPNWQLNQPGGPWGYYERGGVLGLVPAPVTSGDQVQIFYSQATTLVYANPLTGQSASLPSLINTCYPWVYHACRRQADMDQNPTKRDYWEKAFQQEMHYLREYVQNRIGRDRARVSLRVARVRRA